MSHDDDISERSPAYLFGQIISRLDEQDRRDAEREVRNTEAHTAMIERLGDMDRRVGKLERLKSYIVGGVTLGGSGGAMAVWHKLFGGPPQ